MMYAEAKYTLQDSIEHDLFEMSQAVKKKRNTQTEYDRDKVISPSVTDIVCGCCGSMVERVHDNRNTFCQKYVCVNPHCKSVYIISESEMLCMIRDLLKHSKLSIITNDEETDPLQIHKREQEVSRAIDYATDDYEKARQMILECAREKYRTQTSHTQKRHEAPKIGQKRNKKIA